MFRIRMHGRGGQGIKTASRVLGSAFFREGFEVQDAPRYGAERRGAPIFATVRASRRPIQERGAILHPDLVVVADDTLVSVAAAGVFSGIGDTTLLFLASAEPAEAWAERLQTPATLLTWSGILPELPEPAFVGAACAGVAARLAGVVGRAALEVALEEEVAAFGSDAVRDSRSQALAAFDGCAEHEGQAREGPDVLPAEVAPDWVDLPFDPAGVSAPDVFAAANSVEVRTGLWRTVRPVLDPERCHRCAWICVTSCPDGAIAAEPVAVPEIDYDHCKGCMVCAAVCPHHAIDTLPEADAGSSAAGSGGTS